MRYSDLLGMMSPKEFKAKYNEAERKTFDAKLDQLETNDLNQATNLTKEEKNRLDEYVLDLSKVVNYQKKHEKDAFLRLLETADFW